MLLPAGRSPGERQNAAGRSPIWAGAPRVCHGPSSASLHAEQQRRRGGRDTASLRASLRGPGCAGAPRAWVPRPARCSADAEQRRRTGRANAAPLRAKPGVCRVIVSMCATALAAARAARLTQSGSGNEEGNTPLPAGRGQVWAGESRACVPRPSCRSADAEQQRGTGRARRRSPPGEARYGPGHRARACHGPRAARLTRSSSGRGEGATPLPAGQSPVCAGHHVQGCPSPRSARNALSRGGGGEGATPLPARRGPVLAGAPRACVPRP